MFNALKNMGSTLNRAIFEEDSTKPTTSDIKVPTSPPVTGATLTGVAPAQTSTLNLEMVAELKKVVTKRVSAFNTLEEKSNAMASAIPDDTMRTRAAFGILAAEGRSALDIIKAIEMHIIDVDSEQVRFSNACAEAKTKRTSVIHSDIEATKGMLDTDNDLIKSLVLKIEEAKIRVITHTTALQEKTTAATQVENELNSKVIAFTAAADEVKNSLNTRKTVLSSILS